MNTSYIMNIVKARCRNGRDMLCKWQIVIKGNTKIASRINRICTSRGVKLYIESDACWILLILIFCLYLVNVYLCLMRLAGVQSILSAPVFRMNPLLLGIFLSMLFSMVEPYRVLVRMYYFVCVIITALFVIYASPWITLLSRLSFVCLTKICTVLLIFYLC